jgi:hypothetical protein
MYLIKKSKEFRKCFADVLLMFFTLERLVIIVLHQCNQIYTLDTKCLQLLLVQSEHERSELTSNFIEKTNSKRFL